MAKPRNVVVEAHPRGGWIVRYTDRQYRQHHWRAQFTPDMEGDGGIVIHRPREWVEAWVARQPELQLVARHPIAPGWGYGEMPKETDVVPIQELPCPRCGLWSKYIVETEPRTVDLRCHRCQTLIAVCEFYDPALEPPSY